MILVLGVVGVASANTIPSSTMWFQGQLTYNPTNGAYTGTIPAIPGYYYVPGGPGTYYDWLVDMQWETPDGRLAEGGFDIYGKEGAVGYMDQNNDGDFDEPNEQTVIINHDAYSQGGAWGQWWDPDVPDEQNYHLELTATTWRVWGFSDLQPPPHHETPYEGPIDWSKMIATETVADWNPIWTWGEEIIPLECPEFKVNVTNLGGVTYRVSLTPLCPMYWKDHNGPEVPGGYMPDIDQNQNFSVGRNLKFDFNTASSPTMPGWVGVLPTKGYTGSPPDYGWDVADVSSSDRGAAFNALERDLHFKNVDRTFIVDLPKNIYTVTVYIGDRGTYAHDYMYVSVEGKVIGIFHTGAGSVIKKSVTVPVSDGKLDILFQDKGGTDPNWVVIGIEIVNANYCAPVAEANSLWWLEKEHNLGIFENDEEGTGYIGGDVNLDDDGVGGNILDLVQDLAWFKNTNNQQGTGEAHTGTTVEDEQDGIDAWLAEHGLDGKLYEHTTGPHDPEHPEFQDPEMGWLLFFNYLEAEVERCQDVKLDLGFWHIEYCDGQPGNGTISWKRVGGHAVTVAGVDSPNLLFAISDPDNDAVEAGINGGVVRPVPGGHPQHPGNPTIHNIEANASHDFYAVGPSPSPGSNLGLIGFPGKFNFPEEEWVGPIPTPWPEDFPCYESKIVTEIEAAVIVSPLPFCGDGIIGNTPGETCDPQGGQWPPNGNPCDADCTFCGDGNKDADEACDDGNGVPGDGCENDCTLTPVCGNQIIEAGETCDPPGPIPQWPNPCRATCTYCGDSIVNNGGQEQCDDGNVVAGDGCSPTCQKEPDISVAPATLNFKQVIVGGSSTKTVTISNTGAGNLNIGTITITGTNASEFSKPIASDNCSGKTLIPLGNCTVDVKFSPTSLGAKSATLSIPSDDPNENPKSVSLTGTGAKVVVTSPNGGEIWKSRIGHTITWLTSGTIGSVAAVKLFYTMNGGTTWKLITTFTINTGSYTWYIPGVTVTKNKCKVKVVLKNAANNIIGSDKSDTFFKITP
jgi:cysteine-rich repeat protein